MGTGAPGDIAYLTAIAPPDVGLVNNVAPAHLERMGSLLAIADTKAAVYDDLRAGGTAIINADDAFAPYFVQRAGGHRVLRFGLEASAEVGARDIQAGADGSRFTLLLPDGHAEVALAMPGRHNVRNALAAAAVGHALGLDVATIARGLAEARPVQGRQVAHALRSGAVLVDDSYNANPASLGAAIDTLCAASRASGGGQAWLVLGDMRELGADEAALHAQAGRQAREAGIARLYTLGALSAHAASAFGEGARHFDSHPALTDALAADIHAWVGGASAPMPGAPVDVGGASAPMPGAPVDVGGASAPIIAAEAAPTRGGTALRILVKGSRGSAMDQVVQALLQRDAADGKGDSDAA
jgi:UDP-N-acetylmuramoyl-tripeptide--D-alanyl-D-alanine ligase